MVFPKIKRRHVDKEGIACEILLYNDSGKKAASFKIIIYYFNN